MAAGFLLLLMLFVDLRSASGKLRSTSQIQTLRRAIDHAEVVLSTAPNP